MRRESARLGVDPRIVDWEASVWYTETDTIYLTADGGRVEQHLRQVVPSLAATANLGAETQTRSLGGRGRPSSFSSISPCSDSVRKARASVTISSISRPNA